ncbi:hypothetical protein [Methylocella sp.]|uniref:bestrophin-like domain n=1 Tax=Methylocella sp. TaxID=1978226 RepID=UPI0035B3097B
MSAAALAGRFAARADNGPAQSEVNATVRLVASILVVMTTIALSLMLNSAKNTFEADTRHLHELATDLILLDRTLKAPGPPADETRRLLADYLRASIAEPDIVEEDPAAEAILDAAGARLRAMKLADEQQLSLWNDARELYRRAVRDRWITVDDAGGTIPAPLIVMLIVWLAMIVASYGYQAPRSKAVAASFVLSTLLISAALYLILDMDTPASGLVKVSKAPFERALRHFER